MREALDATHCIGVEEAALRGEELREHLDGIEEIGNRVLSLHRQQTANTQELAAGLMSELERSNAFLAELSQKEWEGKEVWLSTAKSEVDYAAFANTQALSMLSMNVRLTHPQIELIIGAIGLARVLAEVPGDIDPKQLLSLFSAVAMALSIFLESQAAGNAADILDSASLAESKMRVSGLLSRLRQEQDDEAARSIFAGLEESLKVMESTLQHAVANVSSPATHDLILAFQVWRDKWADRAGL